MATQDKPNIALDVDALVKKHAEKAATKELYTIKIGGKPVQFADLDDLEWEASERVAQAVRDGNMTQFFYDLILDDDQLDLFFDQHFAGEVAGEILEGYLRFHGWDPRRGTMNRRDRRSKK